MLSRGTLRLPVYILSAVDAYQKDTDTVKELSVLKYCGKFNDVDSAGSEKERCVRDRHDYQEQMRHDEVINLTLILLLCDSSSGSMYGTRDGSASNG